MTNKTSVSYGMYSRCVVLRLSGAGEFGSTLAVPLKQTLSKWTIVARKHQLSSRRIISFWGYCRMFCILNQEKKETCFPADIVIYRPTYW